MKPADIVEQVAVKSGKDTWALLYFSENANDGYLAVDGAEMSVCGGHVRLFREGNWIGNLPARLIKRVL